MSRWLGNIGAAPQFPSGQEKSVSSLTSFPCRYLEKTKDYCWRGMGNGVDVNRNFPWEYGGPGSSDDPKVGTMDPHDPTDYFHLKQSTTSTPAFSLSP